MDEKKQSFEPAGEMSSDWKKVLEEHFRLWLEEMETEPADPIPHADEPDLYSFYEELCVLRSEFNKNARRNHESFVRFSDALTSLDGVLRNMAEKTDRESHCHEAVEHLEKIKSYLPMVELFERFKRIQEKLNEPPAKGFFRAGKKRHRQWKSLGEGFGILKNHFEELLKSQGISPINTRGAGFDPRLMTAVEVQETGDVGSDMVLEEISGGYLFQGHVLKLAEVKISRVKGESL